MVKKKICIDCRKLKPNNSKHFAIHKRGALRNQCRPCRNLKSKQNAHNSKSKKAILRRAINEVKIEMGCRDCGYRRMPEALAFDHLPGFQKCDDISNMLRTGSNTYLVIEEIGKCEIVCHNCHAERGALRHQQKGTQ